MDENNLGATIHALARELFPICRSITGDGVRQTLGIIRRELPALEIHEVPSGTRCFDWIVPPEWNIRDAYIVGPDGRKFADFQESNLHVVGYSVPVDATLGLDELQQHLYSLPDQPDAIPFVTSYYEPRWGFCLAHAERQQLEPGEYRVRIDSTLEAGHLTYGELTIPGESDEVVFLSTYVCHPSLGNNELSGPTVTTFLAKWLMDLDRRRYTYCIVFIPETIGSIVYLSRNLEWLKDNVVAGFNVTCVGDERAHSYLPSRAGDSLADRVALHVLKHLAPDFVRYSYLDRQSDERQYCSPGVDLPVVSVMRTKHGAYPEYHTSNDDLELITPRGLYGGYDALRHCLLSLERNEVLRAVLPCEPQLGRRGLYPTLSTGHGDVNVQRMKHVLAYADGALDLLGIAEVIGEPIWSLYAIVEALKNEGLLVSAEDERTRGEKQRAAASLRSVLTGMWA